MKSMERKQLEQLFFIQRDATVGVADGAIFFVNPAGKARYPDLCTDAQADCLLPEELLTREEETFAVAIAVREESCTVLGCRLGDIRLYTIIPQSSLEGEEGWLLENVCSSMRRTLTVLNVATELLTPAIDRLEEPQQSNLRVINKSYYKLQRLCENLDSLVRFREGQGSLRLERLDLVSFCRDLIQSTDHIVKRLGHRLYFRSEQDSLIAALDGPKLSKLLLNLISNSLKRISPNGNLYLNLTSSGGEVFLSFRDTGAGIPPEEMAHVFTQYKRQRSDTDPQAGVGMGMAIAQEIAALHGGVLLIASQEGKGTTVLVRIPQRSLELDGQLQENPLPYGEGDGGMHMILTELADILDDEAFGRKYRD